MELFARLTIQVSALIIAGSALMLLATKPGTAEHTITVIAFIGGVCVTVIAVILFRLSQQEKSPQEDL